MGKRPAHRRIDLQSSRRLRPDISQHNSISDKKFGSNDGSGSESDGPNSDVENVSLTPYQALLGSISTNGGSFSKAIAQRQEQEQGVISKCEDSESMREGENLADYDNEVHIVSASKHMRGARAEMMDKSMDSILVVKGAEAQEECDHDASLLDDNGLTNAFKKHLDHYLPDKEVALLSKGGGKFECKTIAAGVHKAKWTTTASEFPLEESHLQSYGVKVRLQKSWLASHKNPVCGDFQTALQQQFFSYCDSYRDILFSKRPCFYADGDMQDMEIMDAYLLHMLNHVLKTRDLVTKNNERKNTGMPEEAPRDQGFTRPKVLILLPMRSFALRLVRRLLDLVPSTLQGTIEHKARFFEEFGGEDEDDNDSIVKEKLSKPADFKALFGGNNDDHFRIGIKFTRKSVKLYSDFYSSDVIVASPLGLITRIGEAEQEKDKDIDFLSSIELLVIDYADVILMQNWSHVIEIGEQLNQIPTQQHGTDFMRIRELFLNGHGRYYRQSIILSAFADAGINAFFHRSCLNYAGKVKLHCEYDGVLSKVILQIRQVYERINCTSLTEVDEARFNLFTKQVIGPLKESLEGGVMIFVSSYFDFVRLRNYLKAENMSFCLLGEYTKQSDISRARAWFFHGKRHIMLYTERAHFYHRYRIRGIKELVFYSLPEIPEFYAEITNMMEGLENPSSLILFSQFDKLKLERVVGSSRANRMLKSTNKTFMFC